MRRALALLLPVLATAAQAQISVPALRVPTLPPALNTGLDRAPGVPDLQSEARRLQQARPLRLRELIRRNRRLLEADPRGAAIVRGEIVAVDPSPADLGTAQAAGFTVARIRELAGLETRAVVLSAPADLSTARALERLRTLLPGVPLDFNHLYGPSRARGAPAASAAAPRPPGTAAAPAERADIKVGLIDGGVDDTHPVLQAAVIRHHGCEGPVITDEHGTAVASLLVGTGAGFRGAAPAAQLYAADVYCGQASGGAVDAVVDALAWLAGAGVPVVNVSLVGPPNTMLETVVKRVLARGMLLVAAVGNDGPAAPPLYPASYPGVIGVTAVDGQRRALMEAARGPQVRFAAPGADMAAAGAAHRFQVVRGTSFAAPLVAGLLAAQLTAPDVAGAQRALELLARTAIDLGAAGPDPVYGLGLVGAELAPPQQLAHASAR